MPPEIQLSGDVTFPPDCGETFEDILQQMFSKCERIIVKEELAEGSLGGGWVYRIDPIKDGLSQLGLVAKIASISLIEKEWGAYHKNMERHWPRIAEIKDEPVYAKDETFGGLYYELVGESIFDIASLRHYLLEASEDDIQYVLGKSLAPIVKHGLNNSLPEPGFLLGASYDRVLPVNLLIRPQLSSGQGGLIEVSPNRLPQSDLEVGAWVRLEGFVVVKVDLKHNTVTLDFARPHEPKILPTDSYVVRLEYDSAAQVPPYKIGQPLPAVVGRVLKTRASQWRDEMSKLLPDQKFDLTSEFVQAADGTQLPNPLIALSTLLKKRRNIKHYFIHGDLNMDNIIVDEGRRVQLIDFAEARWDLVLHDFLRLETEVVTKLVPPALIKHQLPLEAFFTFYEQLHCTTFFDTTSITAEPPPVDLALMRPFAILTQMRDIARNALFDREDYTEYYEGLILYLLGALKFRNLDDAQEAPLPKQLAFWGAAMVQHLLTGHNPCDGKVYPAVSTQDQTYTEERFLDAALPAQVVVNQATELLVMVRLPDSEGLRGELGEDVQYQAQPEDVKSKRFEIEFPVDSTGNISALELCVDIETADFAVGERRKRIRINPKIDSETCIFLLTPKRRGELRVIVQVYSAPDELLLGAGLIRVNGTASLDKGIQYVKTLITLSLGAFSARPAPDKADQDETSTARQDHSDPDTTEPVDTDSIAVGDVEGSYIAIGHGAQVLVNHAVRSMVEMLFVAIYRRIEIRSEDPNVRRETLIGMVKVIEQEVARGGAADHLKVEGWLKDLNDLAPDVAQATIESLTQPNAGVPRRIRLIAARVGGGSNHPVLPGPE